MACSSKWLIDPHGSSIICSQLTPPTFQLACRGSGMDSKLGLPNHSVGSMSERG